MGGWFVRVVDDLRVGLVPTPFLLPVIRHCRPAAHLPASLPTCLLDSELIFLFCFVCFRFPTPLAIHPPTHLSSRTTRYIFSLFPLLTHPTKSLCPLRINSSPPLRFSSRFNDLLCCWWVWVLPLCLGSGLLDSRVQVVVPRPSDDCPAPRHPSPSEVTQTHATFGLTHSILTDVRCVHRAQCRSPIPYDGDVSRNVNIAVTCDTRAPVSITLLDYPLPSLSHHFPAVSSHESIAFSRLVFFVPLSFCFSLSTSLFLSPPPFVVGTHH